MESALQLYSTALEQHEHIGHGLSLILPLAAIFVVGFFIGKSMTGKKGLRHFREHLSTLSQSIESHRRKVGCGVLWKMRVELLLKSYTAATAVVFLAAGYFGYWGELIHCYEIPLGVVLLGGVIYMAGKAVKFRIAYYQETIRILESEVVESKKSLMKEIGPEIIQELKATEKCSRLCEERKKAVSQDLERHKWLVTELSHFAWCEGCSRESKCSGDCGGRYWRFTKETLRKFNTFHGSSSQVN